MTRTLCAEVQSHVLLGKVHRLGRTIKRIHTLRPSVQGVDGEASRIAEGIEHGTILSVMTDQLTIVSLVDEEACLLSLEPVWSEAHTVFIDRSCLGMTDEEAVRC